MEIDKQAFKRTLANGRERLLGERLSDGHWEGRLSSSALSTATALCALALKDREAHGERIERSLAWLEAHQNRDGGYGDTVISESNISTTTLCWAAFAAAGALERCGTAANRAEAWLEKEAGGVEGRSLAGAITACYGRDRTFSVPILTMCAISGRLGQGREAWRLVKPLPFELAALPHAWLKWMRLTVVSYALPALVAIGQVRHKHCPPANPLTRLVRDLTRERTLRLIDRMQPESGGFLEAVPLTSFVVMSLVAAGQRNHPVAENGADFLVHAMREDGSWPIDTNLATWVSTLSVNGLAGGRSFFELLDEAAREQLANWLLSQQHREVHPYTGADPGGWAWTDLTGGVPDADDTAGALLALRHLGVRDGSVKEAVRAGIAWLMGLQNHDGGVPTFCRGWGKLPFDQSAPDLTAHALSAVNAWLPERDLSPALAGRAERFIRSGLVYLQRIQRKDGAFIPLWFGNESAAGKENPVYGTARVLSALAGLASNTGGGVADKAARWLLSARNPDGGWGGAVGAPSTIEETALAVYALLRHAPCPEPAVLRGASWLIERTGEGKNFTAAPIGLYFARLWYFEELYPLIFTVQALNRVEELIQ